MQIKGIELKVAQGDITALSVDAIVNPANTELQMGGGLALTIKKKGGANIEKEALAKAPIKKGAAVATSAGTLSAKHVIHAATMALDFKTDDGIIRAACANALKCVLDLKLRSIALPALGCGVGGFPLSAAARIMLQEVIKVSRLPKASLKEIVFCLYDQKAFEEFDKTVHGYFQHLREDLGYGPYVTVDAIIELKEGMVLIERSNPPLGWALPGGFVDYGESLEEAVVREAKEETGLTFANIRQLKTYSDPKRDARFHTISTVFIGEGKGKPQFGDDAKGLKVVPYSELTKLTYAFDHGAIIEDYLRQKKS